MAVCESVFYRRPYFLLLLLLATVSAWLIFHIGLIPGQTFNATRFILYDQGSFIYAVGRVGAGEKIYSEFAWQYGPLALGWYQAFAAVLGNTPFSLLLAAGVASGIAWMIVVFLAVRRVGVVWGWCGGTMLLLPALTVPCLLSINHGPHGAVEALCLAGLMWLIGGEKTARRAGLIGLLLGCLQLLRFGPHLVAGVLVLVLWVARGGETWRKMMQSLLLILAGYVGVLVLYVAWLLRRLPGTMVKEQLWPDYMTAHYAELFANRWPAMGGFGGFALQWFPMVLAIGLIGFLITNAVREKRGIAPSIASLLFFPLYFLVGCVVLFRTNFAVLAHLWMVWPAVALISEIKARWLRGMILIWLLPAVYLNLQGWRGAWVREREWRAEPLFLPNGQQLWFHGSEAARFGALAAALQRYPVPLKPGENRSMAVLFGGGGVAHFFATSRVGRHWWYLPEFVRPWEMDEAAADFRRHDLFLLVEMDSNKTVDKPSTALNLWLPFDQKHSHLLLPSIRLIQVIPGVGYLFGFEGEPKSS